VFVVPAPNVSPSQLAVSVSADGQAWITRAFPGGTSFYYPSTLYEVAFANGLFVASANVEYHPNSYLYQQRIRFFISTDATTWAQGAFTDEIYMPFYVAHRSLAPANGIFYEITGSPIGPDADNRMP